MRIQPDLERYNKIVRYYWRFLTLQKVGDKFHITRERVRQIMAKMGVNPNDIKRAIADFKKFNEIEKSYTMCLQCGSDFKISLRRKDGKEYCRMCSVRRRHRVMGYAAQRKSYMKHREQRRASNREYYRLHKEEARAYWKEYNRKNSVYCKEVSKQNYIKRWLNPKDLI